MMKTIQKHEAKALTTGLAATLQVPVGGKVQDIFLHFMTSAGATVTEAQIRAEIGNIRLTINGNDKVNCSAVQLLDVQEMLGVEIADAAGTDGVVSLNIGRYVYADPALRDIFGFGTADVSSIQIQVTAGTLSAIASVEAYSARTPEIQNLGLHCKLINYPQTFNSTGQDTVDTLPRDTDSAYLAAFIDDGASGVIADSEIRVNSQTYRERVPLNVNKLFSNLARFNQLSGYFATWFNDGAGNSNLPMNGVNDLRLITNFSTAPGAGGYNVLALTMAGIKQ